MLGNPNHYFYECTRARPITPATVDKLGTALLAAKAEQARAITLAFAPFESLSARFCCIRYALECLSLRLVQIAVCYRVAS